LLDNFRHIHLIGIGGSGISALAYLALAHGLKVSGSDISQNPTTEDLSKAGAELFIKHNTANVGELVELVIYSDAIDKANNPEYIIAIQRGIQVLSYFEALGALSAHKKTIVVTGTHGKTTTTAMLGQALIEAGEDPTVIVGSRVPAFENRNIKIGHSPWLVAEGCEYRRNFLSFKPFGIVLLNCELEHVDYYKSEEDYLKAFEQLIEKLPKDGFLIYNNDDENCQKLAIKASCKAIGVSMTDAQDIKLKIPGDFNKLNAVHALVTAEQINDNFAGIRQGLANFTGTARRMELKGEKSGILIIDDYGHHPTEVKVTLKALKEKYPARRLICVFQPHQYSRASQLIGEFSKAFDQADKVIIPNIFSARDTDEDKKGISAKAFADQIPNASWGKTAENTLDILKSEAKSGDLIVTMGAGDVYKIAGEFLGKS